MSDRMRRAEAFLEALTALAREHRVVLKPWCDEVAVWDADDDGHVLRHGMDALRYAGASDERWMAGPLVARVALRKA